MSALMWPSAWEYQPCLSDSLKRRLDDMKKALDAKEAALRRKQREIDTSHPDVTVVHMDDFFLPACERIQGSPASKPIGADFDWHRILTQVLEPLPHNYEGRFQPYDWEADRIADTWFTVPVGGTVVVEGVYATRRDLAGLYDLRIWVECPRHIRLARGLHRDGEEARDRWEHEWMVAEDLYMAAHQPSAYADLVLDGAGY